jgi:hypothetical protein
MKRGFFFLIFNFGPTKHPVVEFVMKGDGWFAIWT